MPFIGKDWRAPGETWVRVNYTSGWERSKLRPIQLSMCTVSHSSSEAINNENIASADTVLSRSLPDSNINNDFQGQKMFQADSAEEFNSLYTNSRSDGTQGMKRDSSTMLFRDSSLSSLSSDDDNMLNGSMTSSFSSSCASSSVNDAIAGNFYLDIFTHKGNTKDNVNDKNEFRRPHCFVKTTRSKEFIGCTSMSEAFHLLDLARAVTDIRRFNYICKVVQILVHEKLQNLSATARKHLFGIIQSIVVHSVDQDVNISTARELLNSFSSGLEEGHVCGSPQLVLRQLNTVSGLMEMFAERKPMTLCDSSEESLTFLDLPREILSKIVCCLPDHISILETAKAHEALDALIERETRVWRSLCQFHFTQQQISSHKKKDMTWRQIFFQLKKYHGLREVYADLIHICCHCKALFWKDHGHPCVAKDTAPSVRVTPRQFVDMLLFL